jgi:hypothetical protein
MGELRSVIKDVVARLRQRARYLQLFAAGSLILILLALGTGLYLFVNAGQISYMDSIPPSWGPSPRSVTIETAQSLSTIVTRIGSVFILLFLVQIFVSLYRYNVRLSAYYNARADALELLGNIDGTLQALVNAFSPDVVDFGRMPKTPIEQGLLLAKEIAKGAQKLKD